VPKEGRGDQAMSESRTYRSRDSLFSLAKGFPCFLLDRLYPDAEWRSTNYSSDQPSLPRDLPALLMTLKISFSRFFPTNLALALRNDATSRDALSLSMPSLIAAYRRYNSATRQRDGNLNQSPQLRGTARKQAD